MTTRHALESDAHALAEIYIATLRDAFGGVMPADFQHETDVVVRQEKIRNSIATGARAWLVYAIDDEITAYCSLSAPRDEDLPLDHGEIAVFGRAFPRGDRRCKHTHPPGKTRRRRT